MKNNITNSPFLISEEDKKLLETAEKRLLEDDGHYIPADEVYKKASLTEKDLEGYENIELE